MAILTSTQLVDACKEMAGVGTKVEKTAGNITYYAGRWGYVLGGQGELYTRELAEKWGAARRCGKSRRYFEKDCARWFGRRVVDCSGMIVEAFRNYKSTFGDRSADSFYNNYTDAKGGIKTLPETPGVIVWKKGHIGIYAGGGKVIESRGYKYGVVESDLSTQRWTNWGRLKDVAYGASPEKLEFKRLLKYKRKMMRGEDVRQLQKLLTKAGEIPGEIDGIFGKRTRDAVKSFQRTKKLKVDGIAGKNTITALGGIWKG